MSFRNIRCVHEKTRELIPALLLLLLSAPAHAVTIDWVTVGDPGNAADTTGFGAVAEAFQIGKYEVTIQQYTDFLNAVGAANAYSVYSPSMGSDGNIAGISRAGSFGSYTYSVIGSSGNKPITFVSWFDAARFANWMQNGQGSGDTETGAYTLNGVISGDAVAKNPGATFYIPTQNQWYKAAYYKGGGTNAGYWDYATQSDTAPGNVVGSGANQANYFTGGLYSVTQSSGYSSSQNYLTDVGAFTNSESAYGTFDQSGNVAEWTDTPGTFASSLVVPGGYWATSGISSVNTGSSGTTSEANSRGFRLASPTAVPEPSTWVMGLAGIACAGWGALRRRKRA